jgi:hypothetical protein
VNWIQSLRIIFDNLSGATARRNRALRYTRDWAEAVNQFLKTNNQYNSVDVEKFLEKIGDVKFDISVLAHNGRAVGSKANNLKNKQAALIIDEMNENVESIRRYLFSPAAQKEKLRQGLTKLRESCDALQKTLAEIKRR